MGMLIGGAALALSNVIDITASVPWPQAGLSARLVHYLYACVAALGAGACLALPFALAARYPLLPREKAQWGWVALTAATTAAMYFVLERHLIRQANAAIEGIFFILLPTYVLLSGMSVPAAIYLTGFGVRIRYGWLVMLVLGIGGMVTGHLIMRDDYPRVHTAVLWVSMTVVGCSVAPRALAWMARSSRRRRLVAIGGLVVGSTALLWEPHNALRTALFRQPGAVVPWVLAQHLWDLPKVNVDRPPPALGTVPEDLRKRSLIGIAEDPVVVLITIDALRADVVRDEGMEARFPNLTYLKRHGADFVNAVSCGSQTSVSLTSTFASRYFSQMRWARHGEGRMRFLYAAEDPSPRFPQVLTDAGVHTHSFVPIIFLSDHFGIVRGFAKETQVVDNRRHAAAREVMEPLIKTITDHREGPAFFYTHLMEPHEPYNRGKLKEGSDWERYLSEVEIVDRWVGKLWRTMKRYHRRRGYIILSADHGEAFGEHGTKYHTKTLYEEMVRVPLIVWGPGVLRRKLEAPVSLIDIGPTVLDAFRVPVPDTYMGRPLWPVMRGHLEALPRPIFLEGRLRQAMYTPDGIKVIEDTVRRITEVYDLKADPGELRNIFDLEPDRAHPAVAEMRAFFQQKTLIAEGYDPPFKP